ncbi:MAG: chromosome condensation regulator RCC1 [Deltaproteobacteria bacterium]|nr:chromosome condensation regulator RCC1 [Deltaproteobacteria bacterium]
MMHTPLKVLSFTIATVAIGACDLDRLVDDGADPDPITRVDPKDAPSPEPADATPSARDAYGSRIGSFFDVFVDEDRAVTDRGPLVSGGGLQAAPRSRALATGWGHTCATLATSGDVYCWGYNAWADLGDRTQLHRAHPVQAQGLSDVDAVAAGAGHTCALRDGNVVCWGDERYGQTGSCDTTVEPWPPELVPSPVVGLPLGRASAIAAGEAHTCALVDGGVMCWGDNLFAQLGSGQQGGARAWADWVPGIGAGSGVRAIGAGFYHTCAAFEGGGVKCWGNDTFCQTGQGPDCNMGGVGPGNVVLLNLSEDVVQIAGGGLHTCALFEGGSVVCWGASSNGEVGNGKRGIEPFPVQVTGLEDGVSAIAAGESTSCAVRDGAALCWGSNTWGKLGVGEGAIPPGCIADATWEDMVRLCTVPTPVRGLGADTRSVVAGFDHSCALMSGGGVRCWGNGAYGSVGHNRFESYVPEPVPIVWAAFPGPGGTLPPVLVPERCQP